LLPLSQVGTWQTPTIHRFDLPAKWANETHIGLAPAYADVDAWEKVQVADDAEEAGAEGEGEAAEVEAAEEE
jgi:hypothetical protein